MCIPKFGNLPIPGGEVTLNGSDLISQGREDQKDLNSIILNIKNNQLTEWNIIDTSIHLEHFHDKEFYGGSIDIYFFDLALL